MSFQKKGTPWRNGCQKGVKSKKDGVRTMATLSRSLDVAPGTERGVKAFWGRYAKSGLLEEVGKI